MERHTGERRRHNRSGACIHLEHNDRRVVDEALAVGTRQEKSSAKTKV